MAEYGNGRTGSAHQPSRHELRVPVRALLRRSGHGTPTRRTFPGVRVHQEHAGNTKCSEIAKWFGNIRSMLDSGIEL